MLQRVFWSKVFVCYISLVLLKCYAMKRLGTKLSKIAAFKVLVIKASDLQAWSLEFCFPVLFYVLNPICVNPSGNAIWNAGAIIDHMGPGHCNLDCVHIHTANKSTRTLTIGMQGPKQSMCPPHHHNNNNKKE